MQIVAKNENVMVLSEKKSIEKRRKKRQINNLHTSVASSQEAFEYREATACSSGATSGVKYSVNLGPILISRKNLDTSPSLLIKIYEASQWTRSLKNLLIDVHKILRI